MTATWPHDASFHGWWVEPRRLLAGEHPCNTLRNGLGRVEERLKFLADAGIVTTVDLAGTYERGEGYETTWLALGESLDRELAANRPVFVHCVWGIGRTGTVVGVWLRRRGHDFDATMDLIRRARAGTCHAGSQCPQTDRQLHVIRTAGVA